MEARGPAEHRQLPLQRSVQCHVSVVHGERGPDRVTGQVRTQCVAGQSQASAQPRVLCSIHAGIPALVHRKPWSLVHSSWDATSGHHGSTQRKFQESPWSLKVWERHSKGAGVYTQQYGSPGPPQTAATTSVHSSLSGCQPPGSAPHPQKASGAPKTHTTPDVCPSSTPPVNDQQDPDTAVTCFMPLLTSLVSP